ncbi:type I toxin-antitoxin system Fst family toxin [Listeria newyorkensis]|uniref:Type I toxin-antitoxin system Fst family toxin n=1 Tax=Listeria newyorkensis TaxID=1497681 RepID=A0A841YV01_9LIST|nr:type I toxin-antitoxin system Fst family toxin [Listeria newyorkensis]MBC1457125.1 type I toxin-antitoxin system Fst family toxin [Listeria newyorkensis]
MLYLKSRLPLETRTASREGGKHVNIFSTILAPVIVGCVLAVFNHWLETRRKKKRK